MHLSWAAEHKLINAMAGEDTQLATYPENTNHVWIQERQVGRVQKIVIYCFTYTLVPTQKENELLRSILCFPKIRIPKE